MTGWYFKCNHCATWAVTITSDKRHVTCNGCGGYKRFMFEDAISEEVYAYAKRNGIAHLPLPDYSPRPCTRCGETFEYSKLHLRMGGLVCVDCYRAEAHPPLLTVEQQAEKLAEQMMQARDDEARMELAYRIAERERS